MKKQVSTKKHILSWVVGIAAVVGIGAGVWYFIGGYNTTPEQITEKDSVGINDPDAGRNMSTKEQAALKALDGDYDGAVKVIDEAQSSGAMDKKEALVAKVSIGVNAEKYEDAYRHVQELEKIAPTSETYISFGQVAGERGDKETAKRYYQKALESLTTTGVERTMDERYIRDEMEYYGVADV